MSSKIQKKDIDKLAAHLAKEGCRVRFSDKGYFVGFPDGSSTTLHYTDSDHRAWLNTRGRILRAGIEWPAKL